MKIFKWLKKTMQKPVRDEKDSLAKLFFETSKMNFTASELQMNPFVGTQSVNK